MAATRPDIKLYQFIDITILIAICFTIALVNELLWITDSSHAEVGKQDGGHKPELRLYVALKIR